MRNRNLLILAVVVAELGFFGTSLRSETFLDVDFGVGTVSPKSGQAATGQTANDYWNLYSRDDGNGGYRTYGTVSNLKWVDSSESPIDIAVQNAPGAWGSGVADPMYNVYLYPFDGGNITITLMDVPVGAYDLYLYGHGGPGFDNANGVFEVISGSVNYGTKGTTTGPGWSSPDWVEGQQYVVFRDLGLINSGDTVTITVHPGDYGMAFVSGMQLVNKSATPPVLEWKLTTTVTGSGTVARDPDLARYANGTNVTLTATANDGFVFRGWSGAATGTNNPISLTMNGDKAVTANFQSTSGLSALLDVDFGVGTVSSKSGFAATGQTNSDYWNLYSRDDGSGGYRTYGAINNLKWADGSESPIDIAVQNAPGAWGNGVADPMYNVYLYPFDGGNITITLSEVPVGAYDLYVYGHGGPGSDNANGVFEVVSGSINYGTKTTTTGPGWSSPDWVEGQQYVVFRDMGLINSGDTVTITVHPGDYGMAFVSGLQLVNNSATPPAVEWKLTTTVTGGGTVSGDPDLARYANGTNVTLTATANDGFVFRGWSGAVTGTNNPITLTMNGDKTVTATFQDGSAPQILITSPTAGSTGNEGFVLEGSVTDNGSVVSARWERNGQPMGALTLSSNQFSLAGQKLTRGENQIRVIATDDAGNDGVADVVVTWNPPRILAVTNPPDTQEGNRIVVPISLVSPGDVGGMSFILRYDPTYLGDARVDWSSSVDSALTQVNFDTPGAIRLTFALPATALPDGNQAVAGISFRARSVPSSLDTELGLELVDVSQPTGDPITSGNFAQGGTAHIVVRRVIGDNNANDQLDIGDATVVQRLVSGIDPVRNWDVTGNDVNGNGSLDSGDVIRVLRVVANLDPQPQVAGPGTSRSGLRKAGPTSGASAVLTADRLRGQPGEQITVQLSLQDVATAVSGVSFTLDYPTNALRLLNPQSHHVGAIVPSGAVAIWNVRPSQNNYATQIGRLIAGVSSATQWASNNGVVAQFVFEIQPGQAQLYRWPIRVSRMQLTTDGYEVRSLPDAEISFVGRDPLPATINAGGSRFSGAGFSFPVTGEVGVPYVIEVSTDLTHWTTLSTQVNSTGVMTILDPNTQGQSSRFYRAKQQ